MFLCVEKIKLAFKDHIRGLCTEPQLISSWFLPLSQANIYSHELNQTGTGRGESDFFFCYKQQQILFLTKS